MNIIINDLLKMKTVAENKAFGMLKVDTSKERVSVDIINKVVIYASYIKGYGSGFWDVERYSFNEWDMLAKN